jgi:hypothetical protein
MNGSRTGALKVVAVYLTGSRIGSATELYSGEPMIGPYAFTVGYLLSLAIKSWR